MFNHYYRPLASALEGTKLELEGKADTIFIVIKAEDGETAFEFGKSVINLENWEIDHITDAE